MSNCFIVAGRLIAQTKLFCNFVWSFVLHLHASHLNAKQIIIKSQLNLLFHQENNKFLTIWTQLRQDWTIWSLNFKASLNESLNLDIDLDQTQIQFDATPGPSRSLNIRHAMPRRSQNVCRTPKNLTPETPKSTKSNFRFVKGRRNHNESVSADPAVKKRGPVSQLVDLDETQILFESRQKFWKWLFYSISNRYW